MNYIILFIGLIINLNASTDKELLIDVPRITEDTVRWNVPADIWLNEVPSYTVKGRLFRIIKGQGLGHISVFQNPKLQGDSLQVYSPNHLVSKGKKICSNSEYSRGEYDPKKMFICHQYSCKSVSSETDTFNLDTFKLNPYRDSAYQLSEKNLKGNCSDQLEIYYKLLLEGSEEETIYSAHGASQVEVRVDALYLRFEEIDKARNYLVINMNGKKGYVDIRHCKKNSSGCKEINLEYSEFEKDWIAMKKHQLNKDLDDLNTLIKELRPCVEKRDIPCIKKYVVNKDSDNGIEDGLYQYTFLDISATNDDLFKELSACLDYNKLLPHLYGTRGINKVCIWPRRLEKKYGKSSPMKIIGVAYPEAVRIGYKYPISYLKQDK